MLRMIMDAEIIIWRDLKRYAFTTAWSGDNNPTVQQITKLTDVTNLLSCDDHNYFETTAVLDTPIDRHNSTKVTDRN